MIDIFELLINVLYTGGAMCVWWCSCFRPYFDLCDGIFLNYNWTESGLESSRGLAAGREGEVYVGIDVFGRGCPGGGGFNSCEVSQ